jgi:hypothetical protein
MTQIPGMPTFVDPMLFSDDDGRLHDYWGGNRAAGIWGDEYSTPWRCDFHSNINL